MNNLFRFSADKTLNHYDFPPYIFFILMIFFRFIIHMGLKVISVYSSNEGWRKTCRLSISSHIIFLVVINSVKCGLVSYVLIGIRSNATMIIPLILSYLIIPISLMYTVFDSSKWKYSLITGILLSISIYFLYKIGNQSFDLRDHLYVIAMIISYFHMTNAILSLIDDYRNGKTVNERFGLFDWKLPK